MKNTITVTLYAVFQSEAREGMFKFSVDRIDETEDIVKDIAFEMLSFPEKDVNGEYLEKRMPKNIEDFYYGNRVHTSNWLELGYKSDVGRIRKLDEDSIVIVTVEIASGDIKSNSSLFVLGDGVGGHTKGEVASYLATRTVVEELIHLMLSISKENETEIEDSLKNSIKTANTVIYDYVQSHPEFSGMATTLVTALLKAETLFIGNVGDSRAYIINEQIRQITRDHSVVQEMVNAGKITKEEARNHTQKNIVTRVVGYYQDVEVDVFSEKIFKEDTILLCCDGLTDVLRDEEIKDIIVKSEDFTKASIELIKKANDKGGPDNISVIISRSNDLPSKYEKSGEKEIITQRDTIPETKKIPIPEPPKPRNKSLKPIAYAIILMIIISGLIGYSLLSGAPTITTWGNNNTNNASLYLIINTTDSVQFNATTDQTIKQWNWYKDDLIQNNNYDNLTAEFDSGTHTVKINASNRFGIISNNTIIWNVTVIAPEPAITSFSPVSYVSNTAGEIQIFSINISQTANVTWHINGTQVQTNTSVNNAMYTNTSAGLGLWKVTAAANNINGSVLQQWIWNVTAAPAEASNITS